MIKYSRQRECIKTFLESRKDHPTAETIYLNVKETFPNISLGTVYRNLSLLEELGEIRKISTGTGPDRFDGNISPHYHFLCRECGNVIDLEMDGIDHINLIAGSQFSGHIEGHVTYFYGTCSKCTDKSKH